MLSSSTTTSEDHLEVRAARGAGIPGPLVVASPVPGSYCGTIHLRLQSDARGQQIMVRVRFHDGGGHADAGRPGYFSLYDEAAPIVLGQVGHYEVQCYCLAPEAADTDTQVGTGGAWGLQSFVYTLHPGHGCDAYLEPPPGRYPEGPLQVRINAAGRALGMASLRVETGDRLTVGETVTEHADTVLLRSGMHHVTIVMPSRETVTPFAVYCVCPGPPRPSPEHGSVTADTPIALLPPPDAVDVPVESLSIWYAVSLSTLHGSSACNAPLLYNGPFTVGAAFEQQQSTTLNANAIDSRCYLACWCTLRGVSSDRHVSSYLLDRSEVFDDSIAAPHATLMTRNPSLRFEHPALTYSDVHVMYTFVTESDRALGRKPAPVRWRGSRVELPDDVAEVCAWVTFAPTGERGRKTWYFRTRDLRMAHLELESPPADNNSVETPFSQPPSLIVGCDGAFLQFQPPPRSGLVLRYRLNGGAVEATDPIWDPARGPIDVRRELAHYVEESNSSAVPSATTRPSLHVNARYYSEPTMAAGSPSWSSARRLRTITFGHAFDQGFSI